MCFEGRAGVFYANSYTIVILSYHEDIIIDYLTKLETGIENFFSVNNQNDYNVKIVNGNPTIDAIIRNNKTVYIDYIKNLSFIRDFLFKNNNSLAGRYNACFFFTVQRPKPIQLGTILPPPHHGGHRLSANQRFEEANRWFEFIFDPTPGRTGGKNRFWNCRPLHDHAAGVRPLIEELYDDAPQNILLIEKWQDDPFKPYLIARSRWTAFMKSVVVKYLDNLIAWGDQLFRRETLESINEATQIYMMAAEILGKRPERVPRVANPVVQNFDTLFVFGAGQNPNTLSLLSTAFSVAEDLAPPFTPPMTYRDVPDPSSRSSLTAITDTVLTFFFCLPKNDKMLQYWDIVADRLFKIRHCMNIDGIERQLPIFEPPIDPALLVQAAAQGVDISSVLNDLSAPLPIYRFNTMAQKAAEFCNEVRSLGNSLLSALEKRDSEELSRIRADHELKVLQASKEVRKKQIEEATENLESVNRSKTITEARRDYYKNLKFMNEGEIAHIALTVASSVVQTIAQVIGGGERSPLL
ncbi:MAG: hypothetical protein IPJ00_09200 [Saprospirales bacterium]|nr:hypothetical protein [Saprospirales bacterium]